MTKCSDGKKNLPSIFQDCVEHTQKCTYQCWTSWGIEQKKKLCDSMCYTDLNPYLPSSFQTDLFGHSGGLQTRQSVLSLIVLAINSASSPILPWGQEFLCLYISLFCCCCMPRYCRYYCYTRCARNIAQVMFNCSHPADFSQCSDHGRLHWIQGSRVGNVEQLWGIF